MSNFEKQIKQQGEAFSIEPREQVWHRVETELDKKKDRRIAAWWWMTPIALLLAGGIFYYAAIHTENKQQAVVSNNRPITKAATLPGPETSKTLKEKQATTTETSMINNQKTTSSNHSNNVVLSEESSVPRYAKNQNTPTRASTNPKIITSSPAAFIAGLDDVKTKEQKKPLDPATLNNTPVATAVVMDAILQSNNSIGSTPPDNSAHSANNDLLTEKNNVTTGNVIIPGSASFATINTDATIPLDSVPETTKNIAITKPVKDKIKWRLMVAGGFANNTKNDVAFLPFLDDQNKAFATAPQNNTGGGNNQSATPLPVESNKAGASFSVTLQRAQWLGKRWQWQAGIGAQYHQIQQTTGTRKDSTINQSALNNFSYRADYFYSGGSDVSHTGVNYRIFLSNDLAFSLLKQKRSLLLNAGIYAGYNLYNNYLVPDYNNGFNIKSENLYNKWFAGIDLGLEYNFKNRMSLGFLTKHDLTKSCTTLGGDKQYWQSFLLNIGIPITKK